MEDYFEGTKLYGDDFSIEEIKKWFKEEEEGYAELDSRELNLLDKDIYLYENINRTHGFRYLEEGRKYKNVLGIGSATGHEFLPILDKIENLYILEPSEKLQGLKIKDKKINYVKPEINGNMVFDDGFFDLVTSIGVLHHIPNVTHVMKEIHRTMNTDGIFLLREPIVSMGDWRQPRYALTKNERGLPIGFLKKNIQILGFQTVSENYCFTLSTFFSRLTNNILRKPIYAYKYYVLFDKYLSNFLKWNIKYHTNNKYRRLFPQAVYFVLKKK